MSKRTERTAGPTMCLRTTRIAANCARCGVRPATVHVPTTKAGFFCAAHCPQCLPLLVDQAEIEAAELLQAQS